MGLGVLRAQIWTDDERFIRQFVFILSVHINIVLNAVICTAYTPDIIILIYSHRSEFYYWNAAFS